MGHLLYAAFRGKKAEPNPFNSLGMEWKATLPPHKYNFAEIPPFPATGVYDYGTDKKDDAGTVEVPVPEPEPQKEAG